MTPAASTSPGGAGGAAPPGSQNGQARAGVDAPEAQTTPLQAPQNAAGDEGASSSAGRSIDVLEEFRRLLEKDDVRTDSEKQDLLRRFEEMGGNQQPSPGTRPAQGTPGRRTPNAAARPEVAPLPAAGLGAFANMDHLDGRTSFGEMFDNGIRVSPLAIDHPEAFREVCNYLRDRYPDAFKNVPPPASPGQGQAGDARRQSAAGSGPGGGAAGGANGGGEQQSECYMTIATSNGHCQTGKTDFTIVTAWLYYHFCGCHSFLAAWTFRDAPARFIDRVNKINEMLKATFIDNSEMLTTIRVKPTTRESVYEIMKINAFKQLPSEGIQDRRCNVFVQLNNATRLKEAKLFATHLDQASSALKEKLGKTPLALLMDEDDVNIGHYRLRNAQREQLIHIDPDSDDERAPNPQDAEDAKSLAARSFSYVHISATNHATLIAAGVHRMRIQQVLPLTIPDDYLGYGLGENEGAWNIQRLAVERRFVTVVNEDTGQAMRVEADAWADTVTDGCRRLSSTSPLEEHQLAGRIVSQLICPMSALVVEVNHTAKRVFDFACNKLVELGESDEGYRDSAVAVSTFHGSSNAGKENRLFCRGFTRGEVDAALKESKLKTKGNPEDNGSSIIVKLGGGGTVSAPHIMSFFRALFEGSGKPMYTAIVARYRAGRSVTFKDSEHHLHLTDGFFHRGNANLARAMHDNLIQCLQRPFGRYPGYKEANRVPPVRLWVSDDLWSLFRAALALHRSAIGLLIENGLNPYTEGIRVGWDEPYLPNLTKPGLTAALKVNLAGGDRLVLLRDLPAANAAEFTTLESVAQEAVNMMFCAGLRGRFPGDEDDGQVVVAANRVKVVEIGDDVHFEKLDAVLPTCGGQLHDREAINIIKLWADLDDQDARYISVISNRVVWGRAQRRLRERSTQDMDNPTAMVMLDGRHLICFIYDTDAILNQIEKRLNNVVYRYQEGVVALAWWYPTFCPGTTENVVLHLGLDLPYDVTHSQEAIARIQLRDNLRIAE